MKIFVGGIANGTTEDDLRNYFSAYGSVNIVCMYIFAEINLDSANLWQPLHIAFFLHSYNLTYDKPLKVTTSRK